MFTKENLGKMAVTLTLVVAGVVIANKFVMPHLVKKVAAPKA